MPENQPATTPFPRGVVIVTALGLATLLAGLEAGQVYIGLRQLGYSPTWTMALLSTAPSWIILIVLLAPAALLIGRVPLDRRTLHIAIPVHVCAAGLFTGLHLSGTAWSAELLFDRMGFAARLSSLATQYFTLDILTYVAIAGVFQLVRMYRAEVRRERAAAELSASLSQLRFQALRNQLDPHFIFNALNAINALALRGDRDELMLTVRSLSSLLRESFRDTTPQLVPLDAEMKYVGNYLALQTVRFPNRVRVDTAVSVEAGRALVPALTLHAIVEGALTSRMRGPYPCHISVLGAQRDDALHVDVVLDGPDRPNESMPDDSIRALDLRLRQMYGAAFGITRDSTADRTAIRLRLPARVGSAPDDRHAGADRELH